MPEHEFRPRPQLFNYSNLLIKYAWNTITTVNCVLFLSLSVVAWVRRRPKKKIPWYLWNIKNWISKKRTFWCVTVIRKSDFFLYSSDAQRYVTSLVTSHRAYKLPSKFGRKHCTAFESTKNECFSAIFSYCLNWMWCVASVVETINLYFG